MRKRIVFLALLILLVVSRGADMMHSYFRYRMARDLQSVSQDGRGNEESATLREVETESLTLAGGAAIELLLLAGIGILFFGAGSVNRQRVEPDVPANAAARP